MGTSSRGHEVNVVLKNIFDVVCGALAYYMVGYGISYGRPSNCFMGLGDFFVDANDGDHSDTGLIHSRYVFQFSFAATSTTIVSGCLAMRCRFLVYFWQPSEGFSDFSEVSEGVTKSSPKLG